MDNSAHAALQAHVDRQRPPPSIPRVSRQPDAGTMKRGGCSPASVHEGHNDMNHLWVRLLGGRGAAAHR